MSCRTEKLSLTLLLKEGRIGEKVLFTISGDPGYQLLSMRNSAKRIPFTIHTPIIERVLHDQLSSKQIQYVPSRTHRTDEEQSYHRAYPCSCAVRCLIQAARGGDRDRYGSAGH